MKKLQLSTRALFGQSCAWTAALISAHMGHHSTTHCEPGAIGPSCNSMIEVFWFLSMLFFFCAAIGFMVKHFRTLDEEEREEKDERKLRVRH